MFILQNGVLVTETVVDLLMEQMKDVRGTHAYFLDQTTGMPHAVECADKDAVARCTADVRYVRVPQALVTDRLVAMREFVEEPVFWSFEASDVEARDRCRRMLMDATPDLTRIEAQLLELSPVAYTGWCEWEGIELFEILREWFATAPLNAKDDPDYWHKDDCPSCGSPFGEEYEDGEYEGEDDDEGGVNAKGGNMRDTLDDPLSDPFARGIVEHLALHGSINTSKPETFPAWWGCEWRRDACGLASCPVCGPVAQLREARFARGEDPDTLERGLEDVAETLARILVHLRKEAQRMGIDPSALAEEPENSPPSPDEVPVVCALQAWRGEVFALLNAEGESGGTYWRGTEAAADLAWYANTIVVKVYRNFLNEREKVEGTDEEAGAVLENAYTAWVVGEVVTILTRTLDELARMATDPAPFLRLRESLAECMARYR